MALSYYSNWGPFRQLDYSDITTISDPELRPLHEAWNAGDYFVDPINDLFYSQNCNYDFTNGDGSVPFDNLKSVEIEPFFPHQEFEPFHYPKRQKSCDSEELIYSSFFNGFAPNPCLTMLQDYSPPEIVMPPPLLPDFAAASYSMGSCDESLRREASGGSLSAQSIAARQRRRRITEKTQQLGKLVPGGQKMNTAEMLQSAYKYIKFLQAQFALLDFVASHNQEDTEAPFEGEELQSLLESPLIQEKLYSTEYCLVPNKFLEELRCDGEIVKSDPHLLPDLEKDHRSRGCSTTNCLISLGKS